MPWRWAYANASGVFSKATGQNSNASGVNSTASGVNSTASGVSSIASGADSFAGGTSANAGKAGAIALGLNAVANTSVGDVALGSGSVTAAAVATASAKTSTGISYGGFAGTAPTSVISVGAVGAERQVTNVAAGQVTATSTDGVNGSQLYAVAELAGKGINVTTKAVGTGTASGSVVQNIAPGGTATFTAGNNIAITQVGAEVQVAVNPNLKVDSVVITGGPTISGTGIALAAGDTLDMAGNKIANVGTGVAATDGVNVGQLNAGLNNVINTANAYTDTRFNALAFDLAKFKKNANAGTAAAMAMAAVPQAFEPGMGIVGGGVSTWMGQQAIAIGVSKATKDGRVIVKATGTINSRGKGGAVAGVGFQF